MEIEGGGGVTISGTFLFLFKQFHAIVTVDATISGLIWTFMKFSTDVFGPLRSEDLWAFLA